MVRVAGYWSVEVVAMIYSTTYQILSTWVSPSGGDRWPSLLKRSTTGKCYRTFTRTPPL